MTVIDVHTHMLDRQWLKLLKDKGAPRYQVAPIVGDMEDCRKRVEALPADQRVAVSHKNAERIFKL